MASGTNGTHLGFRDKKSGMNRKIIVSVIIIAGSGIINAWQKNQAVTPVIIGSYVFLLVLSLLDTIGGPVANIAGGLAVVAATFVVLNEFPWNTLLSALQGNTKPPIQTPQNVIGGGNA